MLNHVTDWNTFTFHDFSNKFCSILSYLLLLGLVSGLRFGELVGLTIDKFDFETNTLKVERSWDYKDGTGFGPLKNEQSKRIISIDDIVMSKFEALFNEIPEHPYDLVFLVGFRKYLYYLMKE